MSIEKQHLIAAHSEASKRRTPLAPEENPAPQPLNDLSEPTDPSSNYGSVPVNMSSREKLEMDNGSSHLFTHRKGVFIEQKIGYIIIAAFIGSLLLVGLLVGYLAPNHRKEIPDNFLTPTPAPHGSNTTDNSTTGRPTISPTPAPHSDNTTDNSTTGSPTISPSSVPTVEPPVNPSNATNQFIADAMALRLPTSLTPEHYNLRLFPYLEVDNFTVLVETWIIINCLQETNNITLNALNLTVVDQDSVTLTMVVEGEETIPSPVKVLKTNLDIVHQFLVVNLESALQTGKKYNLTIKTVGIINDFLAGFYRSSYVENNETKWLAVTQFEATDARRVFPSFDEPGMKATFDVSIVHSVNYTALSNGPLIGSETWSEGYVIDTFGSTPKMSTYLVAFVIFQFQNKTNGNLRVWARPEVLDSADYALQIGPEIIDNYNRFFNIAYPMNKTDLVALPDFNAGAMENWGLITFRESSMLWDPNISSAYSKQYITQTIAHELGHQWFGNLVTMGWWDDLWLNEGFATYMEYLGSSFLDPTWQMNEQMVIDEVQDVMILDSLKTSHPIYVPVYSANQINEIFDRISYGKGGSLVRMMEKILGNKTFMAGLQGYLKGNEYANANNSNLWMHLSDAQKNDSTRIDVPAIMTKWTTQTGFPVVTVERDYNGNSAIVNQTRFFKDRTNLEESDTNVLWNIPLTWANAQTPVTNWSTTPQKWLNNATDTIENLASPNDWVVVNVEEAGYYRVNYDTKNWEMLQMQLLKDHTKINLVNRAQILDDALNLALSGYLKYDIALNLTQYLKNETEYIPWSAAVTAFGYLFTMLRRSDTYPVFKGYVKTLIEPVYNNYGWSTNTFNESVVIQYLQNNALSLACSVEVDECLSNATMLFEMWMADPKNTSIVPANWKGTVYCNGISRGNNTHWEFLWGRYQNESVATEKSAILSALSCSRDMSTLARFLRLSLDPSKGVRQQDALTVISLVARGDHGREMAFNFVRANWKQLFEMYGTAAFGLGDVISSLGNVLNTDFELSQFQIFKDSLNGTDLGTAARSFDQALETASANVQYMKNNYDTISYWLSNVTSNTY